MAETNRRHPNVINVDETEGISREKATRFGFNCKPLAMNTGAKGIGCTYYEQPPGRTAFPRHYHCANEEAIYVLDGEGTVRIGDATVKVGPGDWVTFPIGPDHAHNVANTGETTLRYLCLSTMHAADVVGYPDSNKVGVFASAPGSTWKDPSWQRALFPADKAVDYYDGEDID